jgi:hypothetical protein
MCIMHILFTTETLGSQHSITSQQRPPTIHARPCTYCTYSLDVEDFIGEAHKHVHIRFLLVVNDTIANELRRVEVVG